jgi:hypothetical protein
VECPLGIQQESFMNGSFSATDSTDNFSIAHITDLKGHCEIIVSFTEHACYELEKFWRQLEKKSIIKVSKYHL